MTKAGCAFSDIRRLEGNPAVEYASCVQWNQSVLERVRSIRPTLLVTSQLEEYHTLKNGRPLTGEANHQELIRGLSTRLEQMHQLGIPVVTLAETPRMNQDAADCVGEHLKDLQACARSRPAALRHLVVKRASKATGTPVVDLTSRLCSPEICPAVIGQVLVFSDDHHLTATFMRTLTPFLETKLGEVLDPKLGQELLGA